LSVGSASVANIVVGAEGDTTVHPYLDVDGGATWSPNRPAYLRDLSGVPNNQINSETVRMGARTVNGQKFDHHNANLTLPADRVQAWTIKGAAQHPFHLHVYHMQAFGCGGDYEDGEYYDVIASNCDVRFDTNAATTTAYDGRTIMHCHILEHEDQGAMGWMNLVGGILKPEFPTDSPDPPFGEYYPLAAGNCGNGTCESEESRCTCAADCGAPETTELMCSDGQDDDCDGAVDCDDTDCSASCGPTCGDMSCDPGETSCNCPTDCGAAGSMESSCSDGQDDDCDGLVDCDDADCTGTVACVCDGDGTCDPGEDCTNCGSDCDGRQNGRPANRYCCGDGIMSNAEGDGTICDGNY